MKTLKKILKTIGIILAVLIVASAGYLIYQYFSNQNYFAQSEKAFRYPELDIGYVPQGITYDESRDCFLISGYKTGKKNSPVYVIDRESGELVASASLLNTDGTKLTCHGGGIDFFEDFVYIGDEKKGMYVFSREEILNAGNGGEVKALAHVFPEAGSEPVKASFIEVHDGLLTIGEFTLGLFPSTPKSHRITTPTGEKKKGLAASYRLDADSPLGYDPEPVAVYTLPTQAQGITFNGDSVYVSRSFALIPSVIEQYDLSSLEPFDTLEGVPVYALDKDSLTASYSFPPMVEEIKVIDGKLYVMSEAACNKYLFGKLLGLDWCYRTPLPLPFD